jgi:hypothetical protein
VETEWKIAKSSRTCSGCGERFGERQSYFSALFEQDAGFERRDYCPRCFKAPRPANVYCFWRTTVPEADGEDARRVVLDAESVLDFFRRLGEESTPQRLAFRYVLALMLTRKKALRFEGSARGPDGTERLVFVERRGGERHEVAPLAMDEDALRTVSEELGRLLGIAAPEQPGSPAAQAPA